MSCLCCWQSKGQCSKGQQQIGEKQMWRPLRVITTSWNLMRWMIAKAQACQGGDGNVLRKHARRTASAIVLLRRWEGNRVVRGQQEQLTLTAMVSEGRSIKVTQRDSERSSKRFRPWSGRWVLHCIFRARTCYTPNHGSLQQRKPGNEGKSQSSLLKFHTGPQGS